MPSENYHGREQSEVKHRVLQRYLQAFAPIVGSRYEEIVYVDCMAGPWETRDKLLTDTSFDTALSVFRDCKRRGRCEHVRALLIESDPIRYSRLAAYAEKITDIEVVTKLWDFGEHVRDVVNFAKQSGNGFSFFFIDPTGWSEARIDRIGPLLRVDPGEVLINFMSSWVKRFLDDPRKPFEELLGEEVDHFRMLHGDDLEDELVSAYANQIRRVGKYAYTCAIPILMPDRDAIHYHLVYGTRHFRGLEEFKKTEAVAIPYMHERRAKAQRRRAEESNRQGFLLPPEDTYREHRFRSFHERRMVNARTAVTQLLNQQGSVSYQELYRESMQYSTVLEKDLREWIDEWLSNGRIRFKNWNKGQRVPRPETIVEIVNPIA